MFKKILLYICLISIAINLVNTNLIKLYSYIIQRISLITINQEKTNICDPLQQKIENYVSRFRNNISVSILTYHGKFIVDVNSHLPRIPASNQKILSSAFALDNLGPTYKLKTSLKLLNQGYLYVEASGDPDFGKYHLRELVEVLNKKNIYTETKIPILIKAENRHYWWPASWSVSDRKEEYGAPITKYSIASNASINALDNPFINFQNELEKALHSLNLSSQYFVKIVDPEHPSDSKSTINTIYSAPLYVLLSLVNSESHNFTSEVIFRNSIDDWSHEFPNNKYNKWINSQNFNSNKFIFSDASGLSRKNRVTTYGLSQFLRRMKRNRYSDYYFSSFSILGVRGSLSRVEEPFNLKGKILAKSGTLNNVKSITGIFLDKDLYFSIIINNMDNSLNYILNILSIVDMDNMCT